MRALLALFATALLHAAPIANAQEAAPLVGRSFDAYQQAAAAKHLPTKMFQELTASGRRVTLRQGDWPSYQPGGMFGGGGTIKHPMIGKPFSEWRNGDWSTFYNETFHAWWANVFTRSGTYAADRAALLNDGALRSKYARANSNAALAQEEAYSETIGAFMIIAYPYPCQNPTTGQFETCERPYEQLYYQIGRTVEAVGHSDRPGFTDAAESIYPDEREYGYVMQWVFGRPAPARPQP